MTMGTDTIFALSSGGLPSGVAVVRISGVDALSVCADLVGCVPEDRQATLRTIQNRNGLPIDKAVVLVFRAPRSFTGENCVEFHVHGGKAVVRSLLETLSSCPNCRMAEAGEFSRRAFENGKLDLVKIEGLSDLLAAETEMQRRLAAEQSFGGVSEIYDGWRKRVLEARALIEAELDFADEGDIPGSVSDRIWPELAILAGDIDRQLQLQHSGEIIRDGYKVVIAGPPNAGKSSLLNALAQREVAIVTEYAGTTRDILHCDLDLDGYAVRLFDTAGLRDTDDLVESEGIRRALRKVEEADLVLSLSAVGSANSDEVRSIISVPVYNIGTKLDLSVGDRAAGGFDLCISVKTGAGLGDLKALIVSSIASSIDGSSMALPSRLRHVQHLRSARENLLQALEGCSLPLELRAEFLRKAGDALGRISGRIDVETLLGAIFSEFCVGK